MEKQAVITELPQAQLNLRIPKFLAAYIEPYQSVSEKRFMLCPGQKFREKKQKAGDGS